MVSISMGCLEDRLLVTTRGMGRAGTRSSSRVFNGFRKVFDGLQCKVKQWANKPTFSHTLGAMMSSVVLATSECLLGSCEKIL